MLTLLASLALLAVGLDGSPPDVKQSYEEAKAKVGRSSEEQVKLALWCESHGLTTQKLHHLTLAVLADPRNAAARGLMGLVAYNGRWLRPEVVAEKSRADADLAAKLADYNVRRAKARNTVDSQWKLALWCEENGLKAEANAHLATVVLLDPSHENAWKRLGCKKYQGRWLNDAAIALDKADAEAQKQADKKWKPLLEKYREALQGKNEARRVEAEKALDELTDPQAVRWVWTTFAIGGPSSQAVAVRVLGQIDSEAASKALALMAAFSELPEIRRVAIETLKQRDAREYAGLLIGLLRNEIKYEVRPVNGPGSPGALFVQGQQFNVQRLYSPPPVPAQLLFLAQWATVDDYGRLVSIYYSNIFTSVQHNPIAGGTFSYNQILHYHPDDPQMAAAVQQVPATVHNFLEHAQHNRAAALSHPQIYFNDVLGITVEKIETVKTPTQTETVIPVGQMIDQYRISALAAQHQLTSDMAAVDRHNAGVKRSNDRIIQILRAVSGRDQGTNREVWKAWYLDLKGYAYHPLPEQPKPTVVQDVPLAYQPQMVPISQVNLSVGPSAKSTSVTTSLQTTIASCFGAGTPVRTLTGSVPIESLRVGDRVLTQSTATGALGYQPVVGIHHNPPSPTFLIKVAGDTIVSSPFHRFWKAGQGWVMAREIRPGDHLRLLESVAEVTAVEEGKVQLVYNLDIAEDADFFAGNAGALVHDNTLPDPRLVPFDASPKAGPIAGAGKSIE